MTNQQGAKQEMSIEVMRPSIDAYLDGWVSAGLGLERADLENASEVYLKGFDDYERGYFAPNPKDCPEPHQRDETASDYTKRVYQCAGLTIT
jgi:hypothetical protein